MYMYREVSTMYISSVSVVRLAMFIILHIQRGFNYILSISVVWLTPKSLCTIWVYLMATKPRAVCYFMLHAFKSIQKGRTLSTFD